jgi:hypothetical protein
VNNDCEDGVELTLVADFNSDKPSVAEFALLEACMSELISALLDAAPDTEE